MHSFPVNDAAGSVLQPARRRRHVERIVQRVDQLRVRVPGPRPCVSHPGSSLDRQRTTAPGVLDVGRNPLGGHEIAQNGSFRFASEGESLTTGGDSADPANAHRG